MKAIARCEWVSPLKEFTTKKGDTMTKIDAKFSFADSDDSFMNEECVHSSTSVPN